MNFTQQPRKLLYEFTAKFYPHEMITIAGFWATVHPQIIRCHLSRASQTDQSYSMYNGSKDTRQLRLWIMYLLFTICCLCSGK